MATSNKSTKEKRKGSAPRGNSTSSGNTSARQPTASSSAARNGGTGPIPQPSELASVQQVHTPPPECLQGDNGLWDDRQCVPVQRLWQQHLNVDMAPSTIEYISPMDQWQGQSVLDEPWHNVYGVFDANLPQISEDPAISGGWPGTAWSMEVQPDQQQQGR